MSSRGIIVNLYVYLEPYASILYVFVVISATITSPTTPISYLRQP